MTGVGAMPAWMEGLGEYVDARVRAIVGATPSSMTARYGVITQASPVRVQLDDDPSGFAGYAPACLYQPKVGDRVLVIGWGTQLVIVGPSGGPTITAPGWEACSFYTPNGFTQVSGTDKAQEREVGGFVQLRGSFQQTTAGGNFDNGILVGMPQSPVTQMVGWGQWQTGGRAALIIAAGNTEVVADITASSGTFGAGWVRIAGGAGYWTTPW